MKLHVHEMLWSLFIIVVYLENIATISDREYASIPDLFHIDDYDKCMLHGNETLYCTIKLQLYPIHPGNSSRVWQIIEELSSKSSNYRHDWLRYGVCVPETCPNSGRDRIEIGLKQCFNQKFEKHGLVVEVVELNCQTKEPPYPIDIYDISILIILIIYLIFVAIASLYEGLARYKPKCEYEETTKSWYGKILACFSIPQNWHRLVSINTKNPDIKSLRYIQAVRFYNMICVILAHTIMINLATPIVNPLYTETVTKKMLNMFIANGCYVVQTFFVISGWLLTFHLYEAFDNKQKLTFSKLLLVFINRYLRLTSALIVILAFHCTWLVHLGRGPFWDNLVGVEYRRCRTNWWTNLLYINNYVNKEEMCLQQTWYLAVDTQLFILSLLIIKLMIRFPKFVKIILGSVIIIGLLIPFFISYSNDVDIIIRKYPEPLYDLLLTIPHWHLMYTSTVNNIVGYTIGIIFGYVFYKKRTFTITTPKWFIAFWWIFCYGGAISIILVAGRMYAEDFVPIRWQSALYWAFGRNIFALCLATGIYGLTLKIGWITRYACQAVPVQILGRLSFSAYLVHVGLLKATRGIQRAPLFLSDYQIFYSLLSDIGITYLAATVLCLLIEMPLSALQKLILHPDKFKNDEIKANV